MTDQAEENTQEGNQDNGNIEELKSADAKLIRRGARKITNEDIQKVVRKSDEIRKRFSPKGALGRFVEDGKLMLSVVKDYWTGKYRKIPFLAIGAIVFSLLYVLDPWDIMPDVLPIIGQIDDGTVVTICLLMVEQELMAYKKWKVESRG